MAKNLALGMDVNSVRWCLSDFRKAAQRERFEKPKVFDSGDGLCWIYGYDVLQSD